MKKTKYKKMRKSKHITRSRRGGVREQAARATTLQQGLEQRTNQPGNDLVSHIFSLESPRQREQARARMAANTASAAIQADDRVRIATLENLLRRAHLAEPDLARRLQRQSLAGPSQPVLRDLRERGEARRNYNQAFFDDMDWARRENDRSYREAMQRSYPDIDLNNIPLNLAIEPHRQVAERGTPFDNLP